METATLQILNDSSNLIKKGFSNEMATKFILCGLTNPNSENYWIYLKIIRDETLIDIAIKYLELKNYNGICTSSSSCGLFDAFIYYKNSTPIRVRDAQHLISRAGILEISNGRDVICFTVIDLIRALDGDGFEKWLSEIAN